MRRAAAPCYLAGRRSVAPVESPLLIVLKLIVLTEYVTAMARARGSGGASGVPVLARRALTVVGDKKLEPERLGEAAIRLEVIAVLAMPGRVLGARQQQAVPVGGPRLQIVLEQAEPQLLVVRIVADLAGRRGQRLDQGRAVGARLQIGRREPDRLLRAQGEQRLLEAREELAGAELLRARRRRDGARAVVGGVGLVLGGAVDEES